MSELIDREATVKQICKMGEMLGGHDRDVVISIALFVQDDKTAFPTVEARPHGEWEDNKCTNCGEKAFHDVDAYGTADGYVLTPWCPWCGADMRKRR